MKHLIIYAYPHDQGYMSAILESVKEGLGKNELCEVIDLYQETFNPTLYFDKEHKRRDLQYNQEMKQYREKILWADQLIFIFPIWWSGMPAILKGFIDRVFTKGFAYGFDGILMKGYLKNKSAWIITSYDAPFFYGRFLQQDYGSVLKNQILKSCGVSPIRQDVLPNIKGSTIQKRVKFLEKIKVRATKMTKKNG